MKSFWTLKGKMKEQYKIGVPSDDGVFTLTETVMVNGELEESYLRVSLGGLTFDRPLKHLLGDTFYMAIQHDD